MDRTLARAAAMKLVYEWEMGGCGGEDTLLGLIEVPQDDDQRAYIEDSLQGVIAHQADIDALIAKYASGWSIERMNRVDLAILRLAIFEMLFPSGVPVPVAMNEAVELANAYSTDRSGGFVNGVLGSVRREKGV